MQAYESVLDLNQITFFFFFHPVPCKGFNIRWGGGNVSHFVKCEVEGKWPHGFQYVARRSEELDKRCRGSPSRGTVTPSTGPQRRLERPSQSSGLKMRQNPWQDFKTNVHRCPPEPLSKDELSKVDAFMSLSTVTAAEGEFLFAENEIHVSYFSHVRVMHCIELLLISHYNTIMFAVMTWQKISRWHILLTCVHSGNSN